MTKRYKRNAAASAQRGQDEMRDAAAKARPTPTPAVEHPGGMFRIGVDTPETHHGIVPAFADPAEWQRQALTVTPDIIEAQDRELNVTALLREIETRPLRVERRELVIAEREALAKATGVPFVPADRGKERSFQLARFMDALVEAEFEHRNQHRKTTLDSIVADSERILLESFQYEVRRIQARTIVRLTGTTAQ